MSPRPSLCAVAAVLLAQLTTPVSGQTTHTYDIRRTGGEFRVIPASGVMSDVPLEPGIGAVLQFRCGSGIDCNQVTAAVVEAATAATARPELTERSSTEATLRVTPAMAGHLTVRVGDAGVQPTIRLIASELPDRARANSDPLAVQRSEVECAIQAGLQGGYSGATNTAEMVVAVDGFVISRPTLPLDENDRLVVHLVGDPEVLRTARVVRTSPVRATGQFRVAGDDISGRIQRHALTEECGIARVELADFAPGEGVFRITTTAPDARQPAAADVSVRVNPLFHGAFSFGPVLTGVRNRAYTLLADSTVAESTAGWSEGAYVLSYTHFLRGPFDLEKTGSVGVNPMIGISLTRPLESVFAGLTLDVSQGAAYLTFGAHGREVTRLVDREGVAVGTRLPAGFTAVPTREVWRWGGFVGIGVDLRAAVSLFGKVLTGG